MLCPRCTTTMISGQDHGVRMSGCPSCGGRFVADADLRQVVDGAQVDDDSDLTAALARAGSAATVVHRDTTAQLPCPVCAAAMDRRVYQYDSGVWVDTCAVHGIWLDGLELEQLRAFGAAMVQEAEPTGAEPAAGQQRSGVQRAISVLLDVLSLP